MRIARSAYFITVNILRQHDGRKPGRSRIQENKKCRNEPDCNYYEALVDAGGAKILEIEAEV